MPIWSYSTHIKQLLRDHPLPRSFDRLLLGIYEQGNTPPKKSHVLNCQFTPPMYSFKFKFTIR